MFNHHLLHNFINDLKCHYQAPSVAMIKIVFNSRGKTRNIIEIASLFFMYLYVYKVRIKI